MDTHQQHWFQTPLFSSSVPNPLSLPQANLNISDTFYTLVDSIIGDQTGTSLIGQHLINASCLLTHLKSK